MAHLIEVSSENIMIEDVFIDLIVSASYFGERDIDVRQDGNRLSFRFNGHCPNEYLGYLEKRYELSAEYL